VTHSPYPRKATITWALTRGFECSGANGCGPILAVFFLAGGRRIADFFIQLVSTESNHQTIREVAEDLNTTLRKYIRAKVILGGCSLLFYSAAMLLLTFPNAISLGVLGGVLEFIPVAGWMSSAVMIAGVGILTQRHSIWMAVLLGIWRMAMDYFISPRVLGKNLEILPVLVLFAVMVGGKIGGIVGIYLSIPLMVVIRVIWRRCVFPTVRIQLPSEVPQAD
jgi:predicted PurR-regulated permease PerM